MFEEELNDLVTDFEEKTKNKIIVTLHDLKMNLNDLNVQGPLVKMTVTVCRSRESSLKCPSLLV